MAKTIQKIQAIPTTYDGVKFRSRLEARWAMFFNLLGWEWQYEFEGFDLDGVWYLPDFWLPKFNYWCEVKPEAFSDEEVIKCVKLYEMTGKEVVLLDGPPRPTPFQFVGEHMEEFDKSKPLFPQLYDCFVDEFKNQKRFYVSTGYYRDEFIPDDWWFHSAPHGKYEKFCNQVQKHRFSY